MTVSQKFIVAATAAATATGVGGYLLGSWSAVPGSFFLNGLKQVNADAKENQVQMTTMVPFNDGKSQPLQPFVPQALTVGPHRTAEIMKHGFPTVDTIRSRSDYVLAYDRKNRTALWVAEHLTAERLKDHSRASRADDFKEDLSIHPFWRSTNMDYLKSGFDRGHLAAAGNHWTTQESKNETFYLSNISPQVGPGFNRDAWNKLEIYTRHKTKSFSSVFVMTGPLYLPRLLEDGKMYIKYQVIGPNNVAVPTHFFKALLCQSNTGEYHLECFVMPNKEIDPTIPLQAFQVPPDSVERAAGFHLFEGLSRNSLTTINGRKS